MRRSAGAHEQLYKLLSGETVTSYIDTGVIYPEVQNNPYSIYSFLLVAGYLKIEKVFPQHDGNYPLRLALLRINAVFVCDYADVSVTVM